MASAAAPEPALAYGVTRLLAFAEELHIGHDRLLRMVGSPMRDICLVVGNTDHQPRGSRRPVERSACGARRAVEEVLQIRHGCLLRLRPPVRSQLLSPADCRVPGGR